jgi:hypothetical protein
MPVKIPGGLPPSMVTAHPELTTVAESSRWKRTGRYDEISRLCPAFEKAFPGKVRSFNFGETPEGRAMIGLAVSQDGVFDAAHAHSEHRPVVFVQGGIHPGEIDGKDAGFWLLREMLEGRMLPGVLSKITVVFIPVFNIDGHERISIANRPNQIGPEEMGWRTTAQNINLNRDYTKADAPEMVAMLRLLANWDPILYIDLHVTDGAEFQHDVSILVDPSQNGPEPLKGMAHAFHMELMERLTAKSRLPLWFYPNFRENDDPASGVDVIQFSPRFSNGYWGVRNRLGMLVETHSWKDYATRVHCTVDVLAAAFEMSARDGVRWLSTVSALEDASRNLAGHVIPLTFGVTDKSIPYDFQGVEYVRVPSEVSGALKTVYDKTKPAVWRIPVFNDYRVDLAVKAPLGGYIVETAYAGGMKEKLKLHKIHYEALPRTLAATEVEVFRATQVRYAAESFEGRTMVKVEGDWAVEKRPLHAGSLFIPIAQANARLLMQLLEPKAEDSLMAWGLFNAIFEQKEMMEDYVAESVAMEMLENSEIKSAFEKKLREDTAFAESPRQRLDFFYRRHGSYDERRNLYPVYRIAKNPR